MLGPDREFDYAQHGGPKFSTGRLRAVLERVAREIGWGRALPRGRGIGLAAHFTFGGYAAHAMEVSVSPAGAISFERVVCAIDVGRPINPLGIAAQMQGGTIDGLSTAMNLEISIKDGRVEQSNFDGYPLAPMAQMPRDIEVHVIDSAADPAGLRRDGHPDRGARARQCDLCGDRRAHPQPADARPLGLALEAPIFSALRGAGRVYSSAWRRAAVSSRASGPRIHVLALGARKAADSTTR